VLEFLLTSKNDFIGVAVMLGFVKESVEYLHCHLFVLVPPVVEVVECGMQFL
jgi:hypothetical protein